MTLQPTGSVWEEAVLAHFRSHMETEQAVLQSYSRLAKEAPTSHIRYLAQMLVEDESRHHTLFGELANAVQSDIDLRAVEPRVPDVLPVPEAAQVLDETRAFLAVERRDLKKLKQLEKELRPVRDTTLWHLIVELMERDTEKHIRILEFIAETCRPRSS